MASTYTWAELISWAKPRVQNIPTTSLDVIAADRVNRKIWKRFFWHWSVNPLTEIATTTSVQDFAIADSDFYRPVHFRLIRTDVSPNISDEKDVLEFLPPELQIQGGLYSIRAISAIGTTTVRLGSAINVTTSSISIGGEYQFSPAKIAATSATIVFPDEYADVAIEGLTWAYMLFAQDPRAGGSTTDKVGRRVYTGQYSAFMGELDGMAEAEDLGDGDATRFPDNPFGYRMAGRGGLFGGG